MARHVAQRTRADRGRGRRAAIGLLLAVGIAVAVALLTRGHPREQVAPATTSTLASSSSTSESSTSTVPPTTTTMGLDRTGGPTGLATSVRLAPVRPGPLSGDVLTVDPGHNGESYLHTAYIDHLVWNGRNEEACDTTGTATDSGFTEAQFNWDVALYLEVDLRERGAVVVMTRPSNSGYGPCVTERAAIGNRAHSVAAISIHADGGPPSGRGFAVLTPVADGVNDRIIAASQRLAIAVRSAFLATGMPVSTYDGVDGIQPRDNLGGENLSTVPKVLIECGNMRNAVDAGLLESPRWQRAAAWALAAGIERFVLATRRPGARRRT